MGMQETESTGARIAGKGGTVTDVTAPDPNNTNHSKATARAEDMGTRMRMDSNVSET